MHDNTANSLGQPISGPIIPLTPAQWEARIDRETTGKRGKFRFLERNIFSSRAWRALSLPAREILLIYLNKIQFDSAKDKRPGRRRNNDARVNANNLVVTNGEIRGRRGVKSERTMAKARAELVRVGFLDVVRPGAFPQPGIYALSSRFLQYPNVEPAGPKPVAVPRYSRTCPAGRRGFPSNRSDESDR